MSAAAELSASLVAAAVAAGCSLENLQQHALQMVEQQPLQLGPCCSALLLLKRQGLLLECHDVCARLLQQQELQQRAACSLDQAALAFCLAVLYK